MKKILNSGCSSITYNENYICTAGNIIEIINRNNNEKAFRISGCSNIISLNIDNEYIYAKNTLGQYFLFDLKTRSLINKGKCAEKSNSSNDYDIFRIGSATVLDILKSKDYKIYTVKYNLLKNTYEKVYLTDDNFICLNYLTNDNKAYFLFKEKHFISKNETKCKYFEIDYETMEIKDEISFSLENSDYPLALISEHCVLTNNKEIVDIKTLKRYTTILKEYFENNDPGYKYKILPSRGESIILVYSKEVLVYNLKHNKITDNFKGKNGDCCSCAEIIDNKLYVGTWSGLFVHTSEN